MGNTESSEAHGVNCLECGCGLPANNWDFEHLGDKGMVYVFYKWVEHDVEIADSFNIGIEGDKPSIGFGRTYRAKNVKVVQYVRNKWKSEGYCCLNCMMGNVKAGYPGWHRLAKEFNSICRDHGLKLQLGQAQVQGVLAYCQAG